MSALEELNLLEGDDFRERDLAALIPAVARLLDPSAPPLAWDAPGFAALRHAHTWSAGVKTPAATRGRWCCMTAACLVLWRHMDKQTLSFRIDSDKASALDALAAALERDRSYLLNEAVTAYLDVHQWHIEQIKAGVRQADAGKLVDHAEVRKTMAGRRRR